MRFVIVFFVCAFSWTQAQEIQFTVTLYGVEPTIGAALEGRLIAGGEAAAGAVAKLPEFVRQGRVEELATLTMEIENGSRAEAQSSEAVIPFPFHEAPAGISLQTDAVIDGGIFNCNLHASYAAKEKDEPVERTVTTQITGVSGVPILLCRWQTDRQPWLLLIGTPTYADSATDSSASADTLYLESAFYPTVSSASAGRDLLASTLVPCRSGQRAAAEMISWIDDDNVPESDQPGFRVLLDPVLKEDGTVTLTAECSYVVEAGGRTRLESGERVRRLEIREMSDTMEMTEGQLAGRKATLAGNDDIETEEDHYVAAFKFFRAKPE